MTYALQHAPNHCLWPSHFPEWLARAPRETSEDAAFSSGAALALLDLVATNPSLPQAVWRARLALAAAAHAAALSGRSERDLALRDIQCLLRPGEQPGPAGEIVLAWGRAIRRPLSVPTLQRALPNLSAAQLELWQRGATGHPVAQAALGIEAILTEAPRDIVTALILADAALARAMGWSHLIPLLGIGLARRDLKLRGDDLRLACHKALVRAVGDALPLSADLTRRAARLSAVVPKLRSKQAAAAVELLLSRDALAPAELSALMSDRAARRFCDRLVALGGARELTGRDTFRLYGL